MDALDGVVAVCLAVYYFSGGRATIVLFVAVVYGLFYEKERLQAAKPAPVKAPAPEKKHKKGGCGKLCTCGKKKEVKTLSSLTKKFKEKKSVQNSDFAIDFTTSFRPQAAQQAPGAAQQTEQVPGAAQQEPKKKRVPKLIKSTKPGRPASPKASQPPALTTSVPLASSTFVIFYSSLTGTATRYAETLTRKLQAIGSATVLQNIDTIDDLESYFLNPPVANPLYCLVIPSYDIDSPIDYFIEFLRDTYQDFRIDKYPLKKLTGFLTFGVGDLESWADKFCVQAEQVDHWVNKLGARRLFPLTKICIKTQGDDKFNQYSDLFIDTLKSNEPLLYQENESEDEDGDEDGAGSDPETLVDVEDMGKMMSKPGDSTEQKQMVAKNSPTFKNLTKQGYTVVGSHSGVKICRWTKSALRGRGSCYKYAFYGIKSHLCMETTPSLSCSNKCVFCWRHGTNPVGTTWRWQVDQPDVIIEGALQGHYSKIKQMRGVPGVVAERFEEAFRVRHCALSLVGEPIFYPYINEFLGMLHEREISSFLVCNAQHPDQLRALHKVTQLYVSIDAPTKDELKKIDRPLYKDYWERLWSCLDILRTVQSHQRTVFRLTLVKGFNMTDVTGYADMVERAQPSLIEIKGATFCGSSSGNGNPLTMQNIPFYVECQNFVVSLNEELERRGLGYGIAAEHAHSCCILVASNKFKINDKWHTHIDYPKFFSLLKSGEPFTQLDYMSPTPDWALWGSEEGGFSPEDVRHRKGKPVV